MLAEHMYGPDVTYTEKSCLFCGSPLARWEWRDHFDACLAIAVSDGNDHELPPPEEEPAVSFQPDERGWRKRRPPVD